eukprot:Skav215922  [mRNA]  locus=scaffold226:214402:214608:- [translate_table: standard]
MSLGISGMATSHQAPAEADISWKPWTALDLMGTAAAKAWVKRHCHLHLEVKKEFLGGIRFFPSGKGAG